MNENRYSESKSQKSLKGFFIKLISISIAVIIIINLIFNIIFAERLEKIDKILLLDKKQSRIEVQEKIREEMVRLAQNKIPTCETVWLENSIHDVPLQRPELVAKLIKEQVEKGFFNSL